MLKKLAFAFAFFLLLPLTAFAAGATIDYDAISGTGFLYCFISLIVMGLIAYYGIYRKKTVVSDKYANSVLWIVLGAGLIGRMIIAYNTVGFANDIASFNAWAGSASKSFSSFFHFYSSGANGTSAYTPFYIYVLALVGNVMKLLGSGISEGSTQLMIKLPPILADLGLALFLYKAFKDKFSAQIRIAFVLLIVFNPLLIANSSYWGQVDSILVLLLAITTVLLIKDRIYLATFFMALAILFKPQAIFFFPALVIELLRRFSAKEFLKWLKMVSICAGIGVGTFFGFCLPFVWPAKSAGFPLGGTPFWIFNLYLNAGESYNYASVNALNFFGMFGKNWVADKELFLFDMNFATWGNIFMVLGYVATGALFFLGVWKKFAPKGDLTGVTMKFKIAAAVSFAPVLMNIGFFVFGARMHERYMVPAAIMLLLVFAYIKDIRVLISFIGFTITNFANVFYLLLLPRNMPWMNQNNLYVLGFSALNVILALFTFYTAYDILISNRVIGDKLVFEENKGAVKIINKGKKR